MPRYLLADIGSTFTKVCLVDTATVEVLATSSAPTTIASDVNAGFDAALGKMPVPLDGIEATLACSSAAGGLQIAAVGLVPELTLQAAKYAALGAGGKVIRAFSYLLTGEDLQALRDLKPDIVLLSGGTDGGNTRYILQNARLLQERLPSVPLIVAGNRAAQDELREVFRGRPDVFFTGNVMPDLHTLNLEPAREQIRNVFLDRIVLAKGLSKLQARAQVVMPTPEAVLRAVSLLSAGVEGRAPGMGELLTVDIGGATTDVYSCAAWLPESAATILKGLPEPFNKRTVEADIGMRHTLRYLLEEAGLERLCAESGLEPDAVRQWADLVTAKPGRVPATGQERAIDVACARAGCGVAVARHCGRLEETYTSAGRLYVQQGKDLGRVKTVIGSGGPLAWADGAAAARTILEATRRKAGDAALKPRAPALFVDERYLMWAMGLLAEREPQAALALMRKHIVKVCGEDGD